MKKLLVVAAAACAALVTSSAFADVYLVETNPNAAAPYDSWATAATTIEDAMGALGEGQTLHIGDGTYALTSGFTVNAGKVVISENGPDKTIFQASAQLTSAMSVTGAGSLLAGVTIKNVKYGGNNWDGMTLSSGGTISNCVFLANSHGNGCGALNQTGGLTVDCTFRNTNCTGGGSIAAAAAVSGGVMERCRVLDATSNMGSYGAIYVSGSGIVRHTVVARSSTPGCGGIRIDGGTVSNCTVVANETTTKNGNAGIYIGKTTAKVVNTICVGNYDKYGTIRPVAGASGFEACLVNCFTDETADPRFQAPHDDDYSLLPDSPCIDADGTACGAYPFVLPTGNGAAIFRELVGDWRFDPQTNKLSAVITPDEASCDPETCYWTFDGTEPSEANHDAVGLTVTNAFGLGAATVKFRATVNGEPVAVDKTDWFTVKNGYVYVAKDNPNAQAPYDTWETAAATYGAGFAELKEHMVMVIGEGNYTCYGSPTTGLVPPRFSTIRSANGPDTVKFARKDGNVVRIFSLTKFGSRVEGFTFNGCSGTGGGPLDMSTSATVANCVFQNATGSNIWGPQFVVSAGKVVDCKFTNISGTAGQYASAGVAVKATGPAVVDRCVFDGVTFTSSKAGDGCGAVSVSGGATVRNSLFINNYLPVCSAIYVGAGGHAENCTVVRNQARVSKADNADASAVYAADPSSSIVNVLTVANTDATGSVIANTAAASGAESCFSACHAADSLQDGNVKFMDPAAGDYSLQAKSVCVNVGTEYDWMFDALDLAGNPRIARGAPDIGAYEYTPSTEIGATLGRQVLDGRMFAPQLTEFTAEVTPEGAECDPATCYWTFDGREPTAQDHDAVGLAVTNTVGIGQVTVKFRATVNGQTVAVDEENWYKAKGEFVYLDKQSANPQPPYDRWETAAKTLTDAFPYLEEGMTILVADGSYPGSTATLTPPPRASVRSVNGPGKTTITSTGSNHGKVFTLNNTGSRIEGIAFTGSHTDGGPIDMSDVSSVISNCVFNNGATMNWKTIVSATGGTIVDCVFTNCNGGGASGNNNFGIAVTASGNTVIDRCVFANNSNAGTTRSTTGMGVVRVSGGASVRNSLFKDNKAPFCSAIWVGANGHAENCTLVRNMTNLAKADDANIGAVYVADATASIVNVLTVANTDSSGSTIANTAAAEGAEGRFTTCREADSLLDTGVLFTDSAAGDYSLKAKSVCVNAGTPLGWMDGALDLAGNPRIAKDVPDIGAYEYTPSTEVGVTLSRTVLDGRQFAPQLTEFAAEVTPEDAECDPSTCYWTFDGREPTAQDHDAVGLAVTNTVGIGMVTVRFRATVNGQPVAVDEENWYRAKGEFVYLDRTSTNPEPPYEKWETAAKSLEEASASLEEGMTLLVADGTYTKTNKIVTCVLPQNATVRSVNGPRAVCFRGMSDGSVVFELTKSGSRLEGLGFSFRHTSGGPVKMSATSAVVTNCVFTDEANDLPWGPMAVLTGGTMVDCIFTNCVATTGGWGFNSFGNALSASGANTLVDRCVFAGNRWTGGASKTKALGDVWVSDGATVRNSLFMDDKGQFCSAIYVGANGHAENCTVVGCLASQTNSVDTDVGAVFAADATASVVNVLVTGNTDGEDAAADASGNADSFDHCFIGGDAKFRNPDKSNFRLKGLSPCLNAGTELPWMSGATDLDGQPRILQSHPDIGCYEGLASGLQIIIR